MENKDVKLFKPHIQIRCLKPVNIAISLRIFLLLFCFFNLGSCQFNPEKAFAQFKQKGENCFQKREYEEALFNFEKALEYKTTDADLFNKIGQAYLNLTKPYEAMKNFEQGIDIEPLNLELNLNKIRLQLIFGDKQNARKSIERLEKVFPNEPLIKIIHGDLETFENNILEAKSLYLDALAIAPNQPTYSLKLAICFLISGDKDISKKYYDSASENPDGLESYEILLLMGDYWDLQNNYSKAELFYQKAAGLNPQNIFLQKNLSEFYLKRKQYKKAESLLQKNLNISPDNLYLKELFINCKILQGKLEEAREIINEIPNTDSEDVTINFLRGKFHLIAGEPVAASNNYKSILDKKPNIPVVQYLLGISYLAGGQIHLARQAFIRALMLNPDFSDADLALASIYYKNNEYDLSQQQAQRVCTREPENFFARVLLGNIYLANTDYGKAELLFKEAQRINPESPAPLYYLALTAELSGQDQNAIEIYKRMLAEYGGYIDVVQRYTDLLIKNNKLEQAFEFLNENIRQNPGNGYLYYIAGITYLNFGNRNNAIANFKKAIANQPGIDASYLELAKIYEKLGHNSEQLELLEQCIRNAPNSADAYSELSRLYLKNDNYEKAIKILELGFIRNSNSIILKNNLAWMYLEHGGDLNKAFDLAQKSYEFSSDDPIVADTLAWAYYKKEIYSMAEILLEESIALKDDYPIVHYHLGMVLKVRGNADEAKVAMNRAISLGLEEPYLKDAKQVMGDGL